MHSAPSVEYPAGRSVWDHRIMGLAAVAWAVAQALWAWEWGVWPLPGAWWCAAVAGVVLLGWWRWQTRHPVQGCLRWQMAAPGPMDVPQVPGTPLGDWSWHSDTYRHGTPVERLECVLDVQNALLLRLRNGAGLHTWVWLQHDTAPAHWPALRRALQAHRPM